MEQAIDSQQQASRRRAPQGAVAAANRLAAQAGADVLVRGGGAVDAAICTAAAMAVTAPHMCGLGGDLFLLVLEPGAEPAALNASGRAGCGADPARLRARGFRRMPYQDDVASVTVPGFVDGLVALHGRFGSLDLGTLLAPAVRLARGGFAVSRSLAVASGALRPEVRAQAFGRERPLRSGERLQLPALAAVLEQIASAGRDGFYGGAPGRALLALGGGLFCASDLSRCQADWVSPLALEALGRTLWTVPPNSQGYLTLASAWIAATSGLPDDPADGGWAFALVEAARRAGFDRVDVLHDGADGRSLIAPERLAPRAAAIGRAASRGLADSYGPGDTTHLCAVDGRGAAVSLTMSNGAEFGARLVLGEHQIFVHNRGIGFSLADGHPAQYAPGRRPAHTLAPLLVTRAGGSLAAAMGTAGADAQPQILLQLLARTLRAGQAPEEAIGAPRWILSRPGGGPFGLWESSRTREPSGVRERSGVREPLGVWERRELPTVRIEHGAPASWAAELRARGYPVCEGPWGEPDFGRAQLIERGEGGELRGAADPRELDGGFVHCR